MLIIELILHTFPSEHRDVGSFQWIIKNENEDANYRDYHSHLSESTPQDVEVRT